MMHTLSVRAETRTYSARWDSWWHRKAPPHVLALVRIAFSFYLLVEAATYLPVVPAMFSSVGLVIAKQSSVAFLAPPSPTVAWIIACCYIALLVMLFLGYRMRLVLTAIILLLFYYWQLSFYLFPSSYHRLTLFIMLVLMLGGADKTFSLRMKLSHGSWTAWEPTSILPQRLLAVQITATYAVVGLQKWWLPLWQGGNVMYYSFITRWGSPLARRLVGLNLPMSAYDAMTLTTKIFETLMPVGLWIPRVRWFFFAGGLVFHVSIALLLEIWWFLWLIPAYVVFFEPEAVHGFLKRTFPRIMR